MATEVNVTTTGGTTVTVTGGSSVEVDVTYGVVNGSGGITTLTGDVTAGPASGSTAATIANLAVTTAKIAEDAVTNAKLANVAAATIKGSPVGAGTINPVDLTPDQASTVLDTATDPFQRVSASTVGTVTSVSVVTANGISGSVATATVTPAITLSLGAITPSSVVASGAVSGSNLSGTNTGDQTNISGNSETVTTISGKLVAGTNTTLSGAGTAASPYAISTVADIESVTAGSGLTGGGTSGAVTLNVGAGSGIAVNANDVALNSSSIASLLLADSAIQSVVAGTNITIDATDPQNPIISASSSGSGDIEGVTAGAGLTGGGTSGTVTVDVGAGTGITVNANDVALSAGTQSSLALADSSTQLAFKTIIVSGQSDIVADAKDDTLTIVAGSNITLTTTADQLTIAASGSGSGDVIASGTLTANRLMLGAGMTVITALGSLGTTTTVLHGNAAGAPTFGAVSLTTDVSGTLPMANGGFGTDVSGSFGIPLLSTGSVSFLGVNGNGSVIRASSPAFEDMITIGDNGTNTGVVVIKGLTSGSVSITVTSVGDDWTLTLPTTNGNNGEVLTTNGSGVTSWGAAGGTPTAITVANEATDTTCFLGFFTAATGDLGPKTNANLAFNSNTGVLTLTAPILGTPTSGTLTNCTIPASGITAGILGGNITLGQSTGQIFLDPTLSADGTWSGICDAGTAGATLAFGDIVYLAVADSRWELADASAASTSGSVKIGMCVLAAASDGDPTNILLWGKIRADAAFPTFTVSAPIYISETSGDVTNTAPVATDSVTRVVGFGDDGNTLFFCPSPDYLTHV